jgi:hypothetical protein
MELNLLPLEENNKILLLSGIDGGWGTMEKTHTLKLQYKVTLSNGTAFDYKRAKGLKTRYHVRIKDGDIDLFTGNLNSWKGHNVIENKLALLEEKYILKRKGIRNIHILSDQSKNEILRITSNFSLRKLRIEYKIEIKDLARHCEGLDLLIFFCIFLIKVAGAK